MHSEPDHTLLARRRGGWRWLAALGLVFAVPLLVLQIDGVRTAAIRAVVSRANPWPDTRLLVGSTSGNVWSSLGLEAVSLARMDGQVVLSADSIRLRYSLMPLLRKQVVLRDLGVAGLSVRARQDSAGAIDLFAPFLAGTDTASAWRFRLDEASIDRSRIEVALMDGALWRADSISARIASVLTDPELTGRLDALQFRLPDPPVGAPGQVALRATLAAGGVRVDTLAVSTYRSTLAGSGHANWSSGGLTGGAFRMQAAPFFPGDLAPFTYAFKADTPIWMEATADGPAEALDWALAVRVAAGSVLGSGQAGFTGGAHLSGSLEAKAFPLSDVLVQIPEGTETLSLALSGDLAGDDPKHLSGSATLVIPPTRIAGYAVQRARLVQRWSNGRLDMDVEAAVEGAVLSGRVSLLPFERDSLFTASGRVRNIVLGSPVPIAADLRFEARGLISPSRTSPLRFSGETSRLSVGNCPAASVRISGTLTDLAVAGSLRGLACGGELRGRGSFDRSGTTSWRVDDLVADHLPVASLAALPDTGFVSARGSARGNLARGTTSAALTLSSVAWNSYRVDTLQAALVAAPGQWQLDGSGRSGPGTMDFSLRSTGTTLVIDRFDTQSLNVSYLLGIEGADSDLSGRLSGRLTDAGSPGRRGTLDFALGASRFNQAVIQSGATNLTIDGDDYVARIQIAAASGPASARISARRDGLDWDITVDSLRTEGTDLWRFTAVQDRSMRLFTSGSANFRIFGGETPLPPSGTVSLEVQPDSDLDGYPVSAATIIASFADNGIIGSLLADLVPGTIRANMTGSWSGADLRLEGNAAFTDLDAVRLIQPDSVGSSLTGSAAFSAHFDADGLSDGTLTLPLVSGRYRDFVLAELSGDFGIAGRVLRVDSLLVRSNAIRLSASGSLPIDSTAIAGTHVLTADVILSEIEDLGIEGLGGVSGSGRFTVSGTPARLRMDGALDVQGLSVGQVRVTSGLLELRAELRDGITLDAGQARFTTAVLSLPGTAAQSTELTATILGEDMRLEGGAVFGPRREISVIARIPHFMTADLILLERFDLRLDDDAWALLAPAEIDFGDDALRVSPLVLQAGNRRIAIGGELGETTRGGLNLSARSVRLDAIMDLFGAAGLGAEMNATLSARGSPSAPSISGTIDAPIQFRGKPTGAVSARMIRESGVLQLDATVTHADGAEGTLRGYLPADGRSDGPLSLALNAGEMPVGWLLPFLDRTLVSDLAGRLDADIFIDGTFGEPDLTGSASLSAGLIGLPDLAPPGRSLTYRDLFATVDLKADTIYVRSAGARSGDGHLNMAGTIALAELSLGAFDIAIDATDFLAIDDGIYRVVTDATLALSGTTRRPRLGGSLRLEEGNFLLTDDPALEPVELSAKDLLTLEQRFGIRVSDRDTTFIDFYDLLQIANLRVDLARNSWLRSRANPRMEVQFTGSLDVTKAPRKDVQAFGSIEVVTERSYIEQFGRRFQISRGDLTFNGSVEQPTLDIGATYKVRSRKSGGDEVSIELLATGRPDDLTVRFQSDPAMELSDIVSYIATGRPASQSLQFGGGSDSYLESAAGLAVGPIANLVEGLAGAGLGLDVVEIDQNGLRGLTLTAGKYVTPRFYVAVSQPISFSASAAQQASTEGQRTQVVMEYEIVRQLLLSLLSRGALLRADLRWEHAY